MGKLDGKVAFITGAARGQGRSHAVRLAQEGADIIAVDIAAQIPSVLYPMATPEELDQTVKEVEALDRRIVATQADVREFGALQGALDAGVAELGRLDIVCANAGIFSFDTNRKRVTLRQFHTEGFVNQYVLDPSAASGRLVLVTEAIENIPAGWRARETYVLTGSDQLEEIFELAPPGKDFEPYSHSRLTRVR